MSSGSKRFCAISVVVLFSLLFAACKDSSSSSSGESSYAVSYLDRGMDQPVEIQLNGESEYVAPGQEIKRSIERELQLTIKSHSPLIQCGFRPDGTKSMSLPPDSNRRATLDCEFLEFLNLQIVEPESSSLRSMSLVSGGSPETTSELSNDGMVLPLGAFGESLLFLVNGEPDSFFRWSDSESLSLREPAWSQEELRDVALGEEAIFLLYADDSGQGELKIAEGMESTSVPLVELPILEGDFYYSEVGVRNGYIVVAARTIGSESEAISFFIADVDRPQQISGPWSTDGELTRFYGDIESGVYGLEFDRDTNEVWLHGFIVRSELLGRWQIPEEKVQGAQLWRSRSGDPVVGVEYLDSNNNGCASIYQFAGEEWHLLRDFCEDHNQVDITYWRLWENTLHLVGSAASGPLIPEEPSLLVVPNIHQPQQSVFAIQPDTFEGDIIDSVVTVGGGYFYSQAEFPEGCPYAPWECTRRGRLYHFSLNQKLSVNKVFDGLYRTSLLFGDPPIISSAWPFAERILFHSATPESGTELWRSDGTATGTYLLREITPGPESTNAFWFSGNQLSTMPQAVLQ